MSKEFYINIRHGDGFEENKFQLIIHTAGYGDCIHQSEHSPGEAWRLIHCLISFVERQQSALEVSGRTPRTDEPEV